MFYIFYGFFIENACVYRWRMVYYSQVKGNKKEKKMKMYKDVEVVVEEVVEIIENEGIMQEVVALLETKGLEVEDLGKSFECIEKQSNTGTGDNAEIYKATYNGTCKYVVIDRWGFGKVYDDYITALETFREYVYDLGEE